MVSKKLFRIFLFISAMVFHRGHTNTESRLHSIIGLERTSGMPSSTLQLFQTTDSSGIEQIDGFTWKWKAHSGSMTLDSKRVEDFVAGLTNTLSLIVEVRCSTKQMVTIFHAYSYSRNMEAISWIELLIDMHNKAIIVRYRSRSFALSEAIFTLPNSNHKKWMRILLSIEEHINGSRMSLRNKCDQPQYRVIPEGVNLILPRNITIEMGANSQNSDLSFTGQIRNAVLYNTVTHNYSRVCDSVTVKSEHLTKKTSRIASIIPQTKIRRRKKTAIRREAFRMNTNLEEDRHQYEAVIRDLRSEILSCREENHQLQNMFRAMEQTQLSIDRRVSDLESCECIPMCITENDVKRRDGEIWEPDNCTSCQCTRGETLCKRREDCREEIHACLSNPCVNNGICAEHGDMVECRCRRGFYGGRCEHIDRCTYQVCQNGAECELLSDGDYRCHCMEGFTGKNCEEMTEHCTPTACSNEAVCLNSPTGFTCDCRDGYSGIHCELIDDICSFKPCRNGGICVNLPDGDYLCQCLTKFYGKNCELQDACHSSPCKNGGRCLESMDTLTEESVFMCHCLDEFYGTRCENRKPCFNLCLNGGHCVRDSLQDQVSYSCSCPEYFHGPRCEYHDACSSNPCLNDGQCSRGSTVGEFICRCLPLHSGRRCEISDICYSSPCLNAGECISVNADTKTSTTGYICKCQEAYSGVNCEFVNPCTDNPCHNGGVCKELEGGRFSCRCRLTHTGDRCELKNYCRANPCKNQGICSNKISSYNQPFTCDCSDRFTGPVCEYTNLCRRNPCRNGGNCYMNGSILNCHCMKGYLGSHCELLDYCARNPCLHGGQCTNENSGTGFRCVCPDSHVGARCQQPHPCRPNPCSNNGRCRSRGNGYTCKCLSFHYGLNCALVNYCRSNPCMNDGMCSNTREGFTCECLPGYGGSTCDINNSCGSNPCLNGATCIEDNGIFECICTESHYGERCQYQNNICVYASQEGNCRDFAKASQTRWYYNKLKQSCEQFQYSGCGGNGNNFPTRQACKQRCIVGSCCMLHQHINLLNVQSSEALATHTCQKVTVGQCKRMDTVVGPVQVLSFKPGVDCMEYACGLSTSCSYAGREYIINTTINVGCSRTCICQEGGYMDCVCNIKSSRKEIRLLTTEERTAFHVVVNSLKTREIEKGRNIWDIMRDEYIENMPIAESTRSFLIWNRSFLRKMELLLQSIDCSVTIPFFDFTLDAGNFSDSIIWQPNFFGGEGKCVPDHPFRTIRDGEAVDWEPCISRIFNRSIPIPNLVDVAAAMKSHSYEQLSSKLQTLVAYVYSFIGGDMLVFTKAYDPLFLSVQAYIDHIFMIWQKNHQNQKLQVTQGTKKYQFGMSNEYLWDGSCVEYVWSQGIRCNRSDLSPERFAEDGYNLQGYNRRGFDRSGFNHDGYNTLGMNKYGSHDARGLYKYDSYNAQGYNRFGYDRRGYDPFGFNKKGYNRDGFNEKGFDLNEYNRYGLDVFGYDRRGFNIYGVNTDGNLDNSKFYDSETGYNDCCFGRDGLTPSGYDRFGFNIEGYDSQLCNYFFNGPHLLHYKQKLWEMISVQPTSFLSFVSRTCQPLNGIPRSYSSLNWMRKFDNLYSAPSAADSVGKIDEIVSKRFCFDVGMFLSWCPCLQKNYPASCPTNPCMDTQCDLHPQAKCVIDMCGQQCRAEFYENGRRVNCKDPCTPNPCQNGGTCEPSRYSSSSESFQCHCSDDFVGSICENLAPDACMLNKMTGNCGTFVRRWFYNFRSAACEEFMYSGCSGNSNNFPSKKACDLRCSLGACCYRLPKNSTFIIGFDREGYDKYGFNPSGYNRRGQHRSAHDSMPTGNRIHAPKGYGPDGYDIYGYDVDGFDRQGYDRQGYHRYTGYNRTGYNPHGEFDQLSEFAYDGFNKSGFDRAGYRCNGIDKSGFNQLGLYYEFDYHCESLYLLECEALKDPGQLEIPFEVISFSPGKLCDEVKCEEDCGCTIEGKQYHFGESFQQGCKSCMCTLGGIVECVCLRLGKRKEIRDLSIAERTAYAMAVRKLYKSDKWGKLATQHAAYMPQSNGVPSSLPWHRYFLSMVEQEMHELFGCDISIPYFDWTIDVGNLRKSMVWQSNLFGGDGEENTDCVRNHMFALDVNWHPCIKRRFNKTIVLANAVNLHLLLHESNYTKFRIQLEMISGLFHLWVGGHMASPFSPYDPIYFSHWAFIDYIWDQWQQRNPMGITRFPPQHRYMPMKPFDVTPDSVLSSQQQLCLIYIKPTLGSMCNKSDTSWPFSIFDMNGLDRHGFDASGYDINGYNIEGVHRSGTRDDRNIYNINGYDSEGYNRSGFDTSGWDKYGFNKFDFNRDGFDIEGYDASGYDKYGFDHEGKTPFGMFKNLSFATGYNRGYAANLFNKYGFNKYGYNKYGFDRNGFDVFGFNSHGLDVDNCNYYFKGPLYMRFFYHALEQLSDMNHEMLQHVDRICPPITALPDYWISHILQEKIPVAREYESLWAQNHAVNNKWKSRISSVTEDLLWLPITPDRQFCFDMNWFSGCPLGAEQVECSRDFCLESSCASHPHAECRTKNCGACYPEFFNGRTGEVYQCYGCLTSHGDMHNEGAKWQEDCDMCVCQAGLVSCAPLPCPVVACSHPALDQNKCCDVCKDCEYDGHTYMNRQRFHPDSCKTCECTDGSVICQNIVTDCPTVSCLNPVKMPGDCCPTCPTNCQGHRNGDTWAIDKCHNCSCVIDKIVCTLKQCSVIQCQHPRITAGECCPECHGCEYKGRKYRNLQNFMENSCSQCSCRFGNVVCTTQQCPPLSCVHKELLPGSCCQTCRQGCEYEGTIYDESINFHPQNNPCLNCSCQDGDPVCKRKSCPTALCPQPSISTDKCCPVCTSCLVNSIEYRDGQIWISEDRCQRCTCLNGEKRCQNIVPCRSSCSHGIHHPGQCCVDCSHCSYHDKLFTHLEHFIDPQDVCRRCFCQLGNVICSDVECPTIQCKLTETLEGDCCPRCQSCLYNGIVKEHGSSWRIPQNHCATCTCMQGRVQCSNERCPRASCENPVMIESSCCPTCDRCNYHGKEYADDSIVRSTDHCSLCKCMQGNVICQQKPCPIVKCETPIRMPGDCCLSCPNCTYEGNNYYADETFIAARSPCLECKCQSAKVSCQRLDLNCPTPPCSNPGRSYSQCCPSCNSCEYERRNYDNGTTFTPFGSSACLTCICVSGSVSCKLTECPSLSCSNPITYPGQCCPQCEECEDNGVLYENGRSWRRDRCITCKCISGRKKCDNVHCPELSCSHPAMVSGECCASCSNCLYEGQVYSTGRIYPPNPSVSCSSCICSMGNITCKQHVCPPLDCHSPVTIEESCCPICPTNCEFRGVLIKNLETVAHPEEKCKDCICTDGKVKCFRRECAIVVQCSHPSTDGCCRDQCNDCHYHGKHVKNGETVQHRNNVCGKCTCTNGNMVCIQQRCGSLRCDNPKKIHGKCCPVCPEPFRDCLQNDIIIPHGEQFRQGCKICQCQNGYQRCKPLQCPSISCSAPLRKGCCLSCDGCLVNGTTYNNGGEVSHAGADGCNNCHCINGDVICRALQCPAVHCPNARQNGCCPSCDGCTYEGKHYDDAQSFHDPRNQCDVCVCNNGVVSCSRQSCSYLPCTHPLTHKGDCCPTCEDCFFEGRIYKNGTETFSPPSDIHNCHRCTCNRGSVICKDIPCGITNCRNPAEDICGCPVCNGCLYNGISHSNEEIFPNPENEKCSDCSCSNGNVMCGNKQCGFPACIHPTNDDCNCPVCDQCLYYGTEYDNGTQFMSVQNTCDRCECQDGSVLCSSRICEKVSCSNPIHDECDCPSCIGCSFDGVDYDDNENFIDPMDKCKECICESGEVTCTKLHCKEPTCSNAHMIEGECCPICVSTCFIEGETYTDGESFRMVSDPCSICSCISGEIRCVREHCETHCTNPIAQSKCCPDCSACFYQGIRHEEGDVFISRDNICKICSCYQGNIICSHKKCQERECENPQSVQGECCSVCPQPLTGECLENGQVQPPESTWKLVDQNGICHQCTCLDSGVMSCATDSCEDQCTHPVPAFNNCCPECGPCFFDNRTYEDDSMFQPDHCRDCFCKKGNVKCVVKSCPHLSCPEHKQIKARNDCCPRCISCSNDGEHYSDRQSWLHPADPCTECLCLSGVITCAVVQCIQPCQITIKVQGQCCSVCASCVYNNQVYNIGENFKPNIQNPCDICECQASPSGAQILSCKKMQCPSLADCPSSCVQQPDPGTCCPTCTKRPECGYGYCSSISSGEQIISIEDKCVTCTCNNQATWLCSKKTCKKLSCPVNKQSTPKGECCPECEECHLRIQNIDVPHGEVWRPSECEICHCDRGTIVCITQACPATHTSCKPGTVPYKLKGQCCHQCLNIDAPCIYDGRSVQSNQKWKTDPCTTCFCFAGKVDCTVQKCRMLMCNSDQTPMVISGECCPKCMLHPATCVAFGDPHYLTFDGRMVHFQGTCQYLLTADCSEADFRVIVHNSNNDGLGQHVSWTDQVTIITAGGTIAMMRDYTVRVNGTIVSGFPFSLVPYYHLQLVGDYLLLSTHIGVVISWNGRQRRVEVSVPGTYKRRTCGLCGNFNNYPQDDARLHNSRLTSSDAEFGNDWKVNVPNSPVCPDVSDTNPCDGVNYAKRKFANEKCKVLRSSIFSVCHSLVNPEIYYATCVYDVCACGENDQTCLCDVIEAYAIQCRKSGTPIHWRNAELCSIACPHDRGYVFDECGSPCKRTCENRNLSPGDIADQCYLPCISGCQCPAGMVEHGGRCIYPVNCPMIISSRTVGSDVSSLSHRRKSSRRISLRRQRSLLRRLEVTRQLTNK